MKRLLPGLLLVASLGGALPADAVGAGAGASQVAMADWIVLKGDRGTWYLAYAARGVGAEGIESQAVIARGRCTVHRSRRFMSIGCSASGRARDVALEEFQVDPLLSSATLEVNAGRYTHRVEWTGLGAAPLPGADLIFGTYGAEATGGLSRDSQARGTLFGRRLGPRGLFAFSGLAEGGGADVYFLTEGSESGPDGTLRLHRTFRVPR